MDETPVFPLDKHVKLKESCRDRNYSSGLCDLPDEVLVHILSFLSLRDAAKTSLVSKRWKYLWAFVPNLDYEECSFHPDNREKRFWDLIERVFSLRGESPIVEFSLHCDFPGDPSLIEKCLRTMLSYNPEKLCLILHHDSSSNVLDFPLKSEILKELTFKSACVFAPLPSAICLPNLRVLELSDVIFVDHDTVENLFSGPSLESLSISQCQWRNIMSIHISAPNLQSLYIDKDFKQVYCEDMFCFDALSYDRQVHINGASLKSFGYRGDLVNQYHILGDTMQLVEKGEINVLPLFGEYEMDMIVPQEFKLLRVVANVKELILSDQILADVGKQNVHLDTLPLFCNVASLQLDGHISYMSFRGLSKILRRSPHLSSLAFTEFFGRFPENKRAGLLDPVPLCFQTELKQITLDDFGGEYGYLNGQIFIVGLLLKTATALERMNISYNCKYIDAEFLDKHLGTVPKGSETCCVSFVRLGASSR